ncbi:MAG: DNA gyrase C-terminal beta-propeller domain-containing protein [Clostridium sp.]
MMAAKEEIVFLTNFGRLTGQILLFATKMAMVKQVPAEEFVTNNRTVAATKLQEGDSLLTVRIAGTETDPGPAERFGHVPALLRRMEIPELKKNSRGGA